MTITFLNQAPYLEITNSRSLPIRNLTSNEFKPQEKKCSYCRTRLATYKTRPSRQVICLAGIREFKEWELYCPNKHCNGRTIDKQTGHSKPPIFRSPYIQQIVLPKMQYGLDVVIEVGRLAQLNPKPGKELLHEINQKYPVGLSLATLYRFKDLFEALSVGIFMDHIPEIALQLQAQPAFILSIDATQLKGQYQLYRAVDFLSGLCLGTLLLPTANKKRIQKWLEELYQQFGKPDYLVSDGEAMLHSQRSKSTAIPHQNCWYHVLDKINKELLADWRHRAKHFLTQTRYRTQTSNILQPLESRCPSPFPPHGQTLANLLQVFINPVSKGAGFDDRLATRLLQFQDARALLNGWERILFGRLRSKWYLNPTLQEYRHLKKQLPVNEQNNYLQHELFRTDPFFQAFMHFKELVEVIYKAPEFKELIKDYKSIQVEFQALRSWLLDAQIHRNKKTEWLTRVPTTPSEVHLKQILIDTTTQAQAELKKIPAWRRNWYGWDYDPHTSLATQANQLLERIIKRWETKKGAGRGYQNAARLLRRQKVHLLTFFQHPAIPISNQALETDHSDLKQLWRRSSGCQDRAYTLVYHGHSASITRNFHNASKELTPLEILGFSRQILESWYYDYSLANLVRARGLMNVVRLPRRRQLQVARQSLKKVFEGSEQIWLSWIKDRLTRYLTNRRN